MRVLIIFNHPAPYKVKSFNELAKLVDLTVLFERTKAGNRPDTFYYENQYDFNVEFLHDHYFSYEGSLSNGVKEYIAAHHQEFDFILMNGYSHLAEIKAIRYMHKKHIPFGLLINGGVFKKETIFKKLYKASFVKKATFYISPNKSSDEYLKYYGAKENEIYRYVYSNLDDKEILEFPKSKKPLRQKYCLPLDQKIFINPCQFIDRKNNMELLRIFRDRPETLLLVGSGPELKKYQSFIKENNMLNVLIYPFKKKKELFELYQACDAHITLSKQDIFGHTVLEAFANGIPVISSKNVISSIEFIKNGYNGYLVNIDNREEIVNAIKSIGEINPFNALNTAKNLTFKNVASSIYNVLKNYEK